MIIVKQNQQFSYISGNVSKTFAGNIIQIKMCLSSTSSWFRNSWWWAQNDVSKFKKQHELILLLEQNCKKKLTIYSVVK